MQNIVVHAVTVDVRRQPLRWKGMWRFDLGGGVELYDARARMWSPKLGTFLSVDEFEFHDARTTLWGWGGQNPIRWSDPTGRSVAPPGFGVGIFSPADIARMYDASGQFALTASRAFDAGNYGQAAINFNASVLSFGAAVASDALLRRRKPTGADMAMMACPIEVPGGPGVGAGDAAGGYLAGKAPQQVAPGVRVLEGQYVNDLGRVEPWQAHYDEFGRLVGRTDYNAGNVTQGIPDTHHHVYDWSDRGAPGHEIVSHAPGEYAP